MENEKPAEGTFGRRWFNMSFAHLHVHTEYSPLDGLAKIKELIEKAKRLGQRGIAITDHG